TTDLFFLFLIQYYRHHLNLHSFPTRRSSDLSPKIVSGAAPKAGKEPAAVKIEAKTPIAQKTDMRIFASPLAKKLAQEKSIDLATDRKSTRLNSSHRTISYAVFCLKKKNRRNQ